MSKEEARRIWNLCAHLPEEERLAVVMKYQTFKSSLLLWT